MTGNNKDAPAQERDEDFISRWSRRKQQSAQESADVTMSIETAADTQPEPVASETVQKELTDDDMPPIDELDEESDFSPFLSSGVSEGLRRMALRKLFTSAKFNVCDGLDDYAEDYTKFAPLGDTITADMKYHMERALKKLQAEEAEAEQPSTEAPQLSAAETEGREDQEVGGNEGSPEAPAANAVTPEDDDDSSRA